MTIYLKLVVNGITDHMMFEGRYALSQALNMIMNQTGRAGFELNSVTLTTETPRNLNSYDLIGIDGIELEN